MLDAQDLNTGAVANEINNIVSGGGGGGGGAGNGGGSGGGRKNFGNRNFGGNNQVSDNHYTLFLFWKKKTKSYLNTKAF